MTAKLDKDKWFRCGKCGHKLGRACGDFGTIRMMPAIEIKCHSCKEINYLMVGKKQNQEKSN